VVRACVTSFKTTEADIDWVVSEMNRLVFEEDRQSGSKQAEAALAHA
jgi:hypothetical protein